MAGWISLHRTILEWEWYDDHNATRLFIHCLLKANHKAKKWRGIDIDRGQFLTSLDSLTKETGLSVSKLRTSISKLEKTGELASKSQAGSRIVTVLNYEQYQKNDKEDSKEIASASQGDRKRVATTNNDNNENKDDNKEKTISIPYEEIRVLYADHSKQNSIKGCRVLCDKTKRNIKTVWSKDSKNRNLEMWGSFFSNIRQLDNHKFLIGENNRNWRAGIEYLTRDDIFSGIVNEYFDKGIWSCD